MLHVYVRGDLERLREALFEIAKERRTLIAGYFAPSAMTSVQMTEITVGPSSLDVPTAEIVELYTELVTRAAKRRRRAPKRPPARRGPGR